MSHASRHVEVISWGGDPQILWFCNKFILKAPAFVRKTKQNTKDRKKIGVFQTSCISLGLIIESSNKNNRAEVIAHSWLMWPLMTSVKSSMTID